jgi:glycosyltransferase involved in cell wall biosynthesis
MILAERLCGIEAEFINYTGNKDKDKSEQVDGAIVTREVAWAYEADILIHHYSIPPKLQETGKPIIQVLHGRPDFCYYLDQKKNHSAIRKLFFRVRNPQYRMFITLWEEHFYQWNNIVPQGKLFYVPAMVDLDEYRPGGKKLELKDEQNGSPNILVADNWREDITPLSTICAAAHFHRKYCPRMKIHIVGVPMKGPGTASLYLCGMANKGRLGVYDWVCQNIKEYYAMADFLITPHTIATRVIREALASGLPIVAGAGCKYTPYRHDPADIKGFAQEITRCWNDYKPALRKKARETAEKNFSLERAGKELLALYEKVMSYGLCQINRHPG